MLPGVPQGVLLPWSSGCTAPMVLRVLFPLPEVLFPLPEVLFLHFLIRNVTVLSLFAIRNGSILLARVPEVYSLSSAVLHRFGQEVEV